MSDASARGRNSRRKGHDFEREVARMIRALGIPASRTIQSRGGGKEGADVAVEGLHIECKAGARPDLWGGFKQARRDAQSRDGVCIPVVCGHKDQDLPGTGADEVLVLPLAFGLQLLAVYVKQAAAVDSIWEGEQ